MTKIVVDKMPHKAEECPFFNGYRKQDGKIIGHKCKLMSDTQLQVDVSSCGYLIAFNETKEEK
jgi:hypothetical protein